MRVSLIMLMLAALTALAFTASCQHGGGGRVAAVRPPVQSVESIGRVHFKSESYEIPKREMSVVRGDAKWMVEHPDKVVVLEGHCDEWGEGGYNLELGDKRSRAVGAELLKLGVNPNQFVIMSYGEEKPAEDDRDWRAWRENRRVELVVR